MAIDSLYSTVRKINLTVLAFLMAALGPGLASAEVWRCTDAAGHTVYQATSCSEGADTGISAAPEEVAPYTGIQKTTAEPKRDESGKIVRSQEAKDAFKHSHPCPATGARSGPCPGYVIDHIDALACGAADVPSNMQWQTVAEGHAKDAWERNGCSTGGLHRPRKQLAIEGGAGDARTSWTHYGGSRGADGITYIGPRGGQFHYSASGRKVYEKR